VPPPTIGGMRYAFIHTVNHPTGRPSLDAVADGYLFDEVGRSRTMLVSLWPTRADAEAAQAAADGGLGAVVRSEIYEVRNDLRGGSPAATPAAAALLDFDGPVSPARLAAAEFGFTERLRPVLERLPGCVRILSLWHPDRAAHAVLNVADSLEALSHAERTVNSTALLPGEDPALLGGPDRVTIHTLTDIRTPEGALR
jgi:hypothetical protein